MHGSHFEGLCTKNEMFVININCTFPLVTSEIPIDTNFVFSKLYYRYFWLRKGMGIFRIKKIFLNSNAHPATFK